MEDAPRCRGHRIGSNLGPSGAYTSQCVVDSGAAARDCPTLADAQRLFYSARYGEAAALTLALRTDETEDLEGALALHELRTSALLFQLKGALDGRPGKEKTLSLCPTCQGLLTAFLSEFARGQALARERLHTVPRDEVALFFLGKLNLNYVWLQLGTLGRRTGWNEYREARKSLDAVLKAHPRHVRARVARAWIDYIVDTRMPRGTRWLLGGGSKKRGLLAVRDAADTEADFFIQTEARFALWDMQVREANLTGATATARVLLRDFPENRELVSFLEAQEPASRPRP